MKILLILLLHTIALRGLTQTENPSLVYNNRSEILTTLMNARNICNLGFYDSALDIYRMTLQKSISSGYKYGLVKSLMGLISEVNLGNNEQALQHFEQALGYCSTADETKVMIATIYNNESNIYHLYGDRKKAIYLLRKAIEIRTRIPSQITLHLIYINMATLLDGMQRPEEALYYLNIAEADALKSNDLISVSNILHAKGNIFSGKKEWKEARTYFEKALSIGQGHGYDDITFSALINLAGIALEQNLPQQAIPNLHEALQIRGNIAPHYLAGALHLLGRSHMALKQYAKAEQYLKQAIAVAGRLNAVIILQEVHQSLHYLYALQGDYTKAYGHLKEEKKLSDTLNNIEKTKTIFNVEAQYRIVEKDKELAQKKLLINKQKSSIESRNIWIGASIAVLFLCVMVILLLLRSHKQKQALKDERLQHMIKEQELKEVKAIINAEEKERNRIARDLHDGIMIEFSIVKMNLSALMGGASEMIEREKIRPYMLQLDKATQSLRRAAHHLMPDMLLDGGLAEAIYYFCNSLQKDISFRINYEQMDSLPRFEIQFELAVYRIVQELLQNVIKHAKASEAFIQLSYSNHQLGIDIEDNGIGMQPTDGQEHKGMA